MKKPSILVTRRYNMSLVHQIPAEFVGSECSQLHGHDCKVDVTVVGSIDERTGLVISRPNLDTIVEAAILKPYRDKPLNELQSNMTGEAIAAELLKRLRSPTALGDSCISVNLTETRKNRFQAFSKYS